jgi:uncharacterized protein DUF1707
MISLLTIREDERRSTSVARRDEMPYDRRNGPRDRSLRAGDAERQAAADTLRAHYVHGRLDVDEYQERLERCLVAKTYAELDPLFSDLPGTEAPRREVVRRRVAWPVFPFPLVPIAIVAIVLVSAGHVPFLVVPFVFFFIVRPLVWGGGHGHWRGPGWPRGY